jgi:hypothetical protein
MFAYQSIIQEMLCASNYSKVQAQRFVFLNFLHFPRTLRSAPIQICRKTSVKKFLKRNEVEQEF